MYHPMRPSRRGLAVRRTRRGQEPQDPNAWNTTGVGTTYTGTTDIEDNDGAQALTVSSAMWVQMASGTR